jgi:hypothetical protein
LVHQGKIVNANYNPGLFEEGIMSTIKALLATIIALMGIGILGLGLARRRMR